MTSSWVRGVEVSVPRYSSCSTSITRLLRIVRELLVQYVAYSTIGKLRAQTIHYHLGFANRAEALGL